MALHCLNAAIDGTQAQSLSTQLLPGDAVLLLGVATTGLHSDALKRLSDTGAAVYALRDDLSAHGLLKAAESREGMQVIDYTDWVRLTESHTTQTQWY